MSQSSNLLPLQNLVRSLGLIVTLAVAQITSGLFKVDITINHGEASPGNDVDKYLAQMPALRPLVLVLKALVAKHGLNNPGIGSYAITCMCIYFLKVRRFPPSSGYPLSPEYIGEPVPTTAEGFHDSLRLGIVGHTVMRLFVAFFN